MTIYDDEGNQVWPPTLPTLFKDAQSQVKESESEALQLVLDTAIEFVEDKRSDLAFSMGEISKTKPPPDKMVVLGTIRLALRWHFRRRALQGFVDAGEQGVQRLPASDDDLHRMLKIGRYRKAITA